MKRGLAAVGLGLVLVWTLLARPAYSHNPTTTTVLFNREITTLLQRKCVQCHADGKLRDAAHHLWQTRPWAEAIKRRRCRGGCRRGPPSAASGAYSNDIGLTPREFEFLISWIDGGVPRELTPRLHSSITTITGHSGMPDLVASPATASAVERAARPAFRRVTIDTGLAREAWIRAIDFKPDPRVTRAAFFSIDGRGSISADGRLGSRQLNCRRARHSNCQLARALPSTSCTPAQRSRSRTSHNSRCTSPQGLHPLQ
jgi:hypothetical protein